MILRVPVMRNDDTCFSTLVNSIEVYTMRALSNWSCDALVLATTWMINRTQWVEPIQGLRTQASQKLAQSCCEVRGSNTWQLHD